MSKKKIVAVVVLIFVILCCCAVLGVLIWQCSSCVSLYYEFKVRGHEDIELTYLRGSILYIFSIIFQVFVLLTLIWGAWYFANSKLSNRQQRMQRKQERKQRKIERLYNRINKLQ